MTPKELYEANLPTIDRIAACVARRNHMSADEVAEFVQEVRLRLFDDDCAIIRKFEGRSTLSTFLTTVITRLLRQYRVEQWGRWRPSAEAKRLGDKAVVLERLLTRDGYTFDEAVKILTTPGGSQYTLPELEAIYLRLPFRNPRPLLVSEDASVGVAVESDADTRAEWNEMESAARTASEAIDRFLGTMSAEDRLILQMRYWQALKVPDIAQRLHLDQKRVYKRLDKVRDVLRQKLEAEGIRENVVNALLESGDHELHFGFLSGENQPAGLSHITVGENGGEDHLR